MFQVILAATLLTAASPTVEVPEVVDAIADHNTFSARAVGYAGTKPPVYELYEDLEAIASYGELVGLLQHEAPVVRLYALQALVARGYEGRAFEIRGADELVATRFGCLGGDESVGSVAKWIVRNARVR